MCLDCNDLGMKGLKRRHLMKLAGLGFVASGIAPMAQASETKKSAATDAHGADGHAVEAPAESGHDAPQAAEAKPAADPHAAPTDGLTPKQALTKLKEGNRRFVEDANACAADLAERRTELAGGQHPWAIVLTCSDSRVTPELIFGGVTLGELFVVRNAGNVLDTGALGTIEYGTEHLHAPLVVVMGHKKCGAVAAACDVVKKGAELEGSIGKMVQPILPVALAALFTSEDFVGQTVRNNAVSGAKRITEESAIVSHLVDSGAVKVIAAVYDIETGEVQFIDKIA
ncbi:carbonic anhydrase [Rhizobium sp. AG855]|nr:carbonic anhydrase [Rhizobium sp. AG855]